MAKKSVGSGKGGKGNDGRSGKRSAATAGFFGYQPEQGWLTQRGGKDSGKRRGRVVIFGLKPKAEEAYDEWSLLPAWVRERVLKKRGEVVYAPTDDGPLWLLLPQLRATVGHGGTLDQSPYGALRDLTGLFAGSQLDHSLESLEVRLVATTNDEALGALVGLEIGAYRYRLVRALAAGKPDAPKPARLTILGADDATIEKAAVLAASVNLARHLVNVPASELNPKTYGEALAAHFEGSSTMSVEIWDGARLAKERMGLLSAVGNGAENGPSLVCLSYRPKKAKRQKPLAFVGKGITFDSGGLDLKDAASMRLMKKDMGGSASLVGLAHWVHATNLGVPCDFYLALAENSVDERSFRPGDVITSRAGITIEIDNTDAEGRLVLADALDVAIKKEGRDAPEALINLATLTGAMRIALGTRLAGMFSTTDALADQLLEAAQRRADPAWRMPLVAEYMNQLKSTTADMANSGPGRFGGAITAALFLQRFVGAVPWAHFDMYAWTDAGIGGTTETGGNGQCIQLLAEYLTSLAAGE